MKIEEFCIHHQHNTCSVSLRKLVKQTLDLYASIEKVTFKPTSNGRVAIKGAHASAFIGFSVGRNIVLTWSNQNLPSSIRYYETYANYKENSMAVRHKKIKRRERE